MNRTIYNREYYRQNAARLNARRAAWRWACWLVHEVLFAPEEPAQAGESLAADAGAPTDVEPAP